MVLRGSVYSTTLNMETGLTVITPNNYGQAEKYRVCYVFHGICGGNADYSNYTMLPFFAYDKDIVFICPEVQRGFYTDTAFGMKYFTYVSEELPETVRLTFNISQKREDTAVIGGSMGGYGALKVALSFPDKYGYCAAFAPCTTHFTDSLNAVKASGKPAELPEMYHIFGKELNIEPKDDVSLIAKKNANAENKPHIRIFCGENDGFFDEDRAFTDELCALGYSADFTPMPGNHDFDFFNAATRAAVESWKSNKNPE